jgi:ADP-heptose:LPS heptosyltransferase
VNILVVKPSSMGDIIHAFPAVDLLRREFPDATITWLVNDTFAGLIELLPGVDDVVLFRRKRLGKIRHWHELIPFARELRQHNFDLAIDFQGLFRSGLLTWLSGAPTRIGFHAAREGARMFYTEKVMVPANLTHAVDKNVFLVRSALNLAGEVRIPPLRQHHDFAKLARQLLQQHRLDEGDSLLAVAPSARWGTKRWNSRTPPSGCLARTTSAMWPRRCGATAGRPIPSVSPGGPTLVPCASCCVLPTRCWPTTPARCIWRRLSACQRWLSSDRPRRI